MNILFLASGHFALPSLDSLRASHHNILHIFSQPDRPAGRGTKLTPTPVSQYALAHNLPLTRTQDINTESSLAQLRALQPDALVVIAFGQKLSNDLLAIARMNINLHSSLLPKYRGAAPINWAVLNNDPIAGVCVIEVTPVMDAGDILASASTPIGDSETAGELHDRLATLGAPLLPTVLNQIAANSLTRTPQDHTKKSRAPKLSRDLSFIDFNQPAPLVSAKIRGLSPWPAVHVELLDPSGNPRTTASLLKCRATSSTAAHPPEITGTFLPDKSVACSTGSLELLILQPANKKPMPFSDFSNGYHLAPGAKLRSLLPVPPSSSTL